MEPEEIDRIGDRVVAIFAQAELTLLDAMARRAARFGDDSKPAPGQVELVAELTRFRQIAQQVGMVIEEQAPAEILAAIMQAYGEGWMVAYGEGFELSDDTGAPLAPVASVPNVSGEAVVALATATTQTVTDPVPSMLRVAHDAYRDVLAATVGDTITGAATVKATMQRSLDRFADRGIHGFVDKSGRAWRLSSYAEMATRTATMRAYNQGHIDRATEAGHDLVIISAHSRPADVCQPYERQVLSISGDTEPRGIRNRDTMRMNKVRVKASLDEARRNGLYHPNCRHTQSVYVHGMSDTRPTEPDPEGYADTQQLRYYERQVRKWKRREAASIDDATRTDARRRVRAYQSRIRDHTSQRGLQRQRDREQITGRYAEQRKPIPPGEKQRLAEITGRSQYAGPEGSTSTPTRSERRASEDAELDRLSADQLAVEAEKAIASGDFDRLDQLQAAEERAKQRDLVAPATPHTDPARNKWDTDSMSDGELETALIEHAGDDREFAAISAVLEKRQHAAIIAEQAAEARRAKQREARRRRREQKTDAEFAQMEALVEQGWDWEDAAAHVQGATVEKMRRQDAIRSLRASGFNGRGFDELTQAAWKLRREQEHNRAEDATRGHMTTPYWQRKGYDPKRFWSSHEQTIRNRASDELKLWFDENGFTTLQDFRDEFLDPQAVKERRDLRKDFLQ